MNFDKFTPQALRKGIEIELQKTTDTKQAAEIALARLKSNPEYYETMEKAKYIKRTGTPGHYKYFYAEDIQKQKTAEKPPADKSGKIETEYAGPCDRLRQKEGGEKFWQKMMDTKKKISESDFLKSVNIKNMLDEDETWSDFKKVAEGEGDPIKLYESDNAFFVQQAGFEFIWKKKQQSEKPVEKKEEKSEEQEDDSYKGSHQPPQRGDDVVGSGHDLTDIFPDDIYSPKAARLYSAGFSYDQKAIDVIQGMRGKPEKEITIYRAVPKGASDEIKKDSWVSITPDYAHEHGKGPLKGEYKIISKKIKAKELLTDGDSIHEWGYSPMTKASILLKADKSGHKYIRKIERPGQKPLYFYTEKDYKDYQKETEQKKEGWIGKMANFFGFKDKAQVMNRLKTDYNTLQLDTKHVTWDDWKGHVSEYFTNKDKWDRFFTGKKEKKEPGEKKETDKKEKAEKQKSRSGLKLSLMKAIHGLYGGQAVKQEVPAGVVPVNKYDASTPKEKGWSPSPSGNMIITPNKNIIDKVIGADEWFIADEDGYFKDKDFATKDEAIIAWKEYNYRDKNIVIPEAPVTSAVPVEAVEEKPVQNEIEKKALQIGYKKVYHGTSAIDFKKFKDLSMFTDNKNEAIGFAEGKHLGGGLGGKKRIMEVYIPYNKIKNIDNEIMEGIDEGFTDDDVIKKEIIKARKEGFEVLSFEHPANYKDNFSVFIPINVNDIKTEQDIENILSDTPAPDNFATMPESEKQPETSEQKAVDKKAVQAIATVTPENRAEKEAEAMGETKEPWGMTFKQYKKTLIGKRDERIIKQLTKDIERYKKIIAEEKDDSSPYSRKNWATKRLKEYQDVLDKYIRGEIDEKQNPNPAWDYLQKQYDAIKDKNSAEAKSLSRKLSIRENKAKKEHERLITMAIKDGKTIPADVLKEYPELSKDMAKEIKIPDIGYEPVETIIDVNLGTDAEKMNIKINNYARIKAKDVYLIDESIILNVPRPSYIPELDVESFAGYNGRDQMFDVVRLDANKYILVDKKYQTDDTKRMGRSMTGWQNPKYVDKRTEKEKIEQSSYYLMNAETLAATWDYYQKLYTAKEQDVHNKKQDEEERKYYKNKAEYEAKKGAGSWPYAEFKRTGKRVPKKSPSSNSIAYRNAFMIADFLGMKAPDGKGLTQKEIPKSAKEGSPEKRMIFDAYQSMLVELEYKINDMRIQKQYDDENDTYKKGQETAYGDSGLKDNLKLSHGVMIKRQNGTEIQDPDITKIGMLMDDVFSVFHDRKSMAEKYGLKISYAGEKRMHASKAVGMFIPKYKTIAISDYSIEGRGFTFAHEFAHFMDAYVGEKQEQYFSSDKDGTISNTIAKTFRKKMKFTKEGKGESDYVKRTCECFARAMEQFYAIKKNEHEELYKERNQDGRYVEHETFIRDIMPLCEQFFTENENMLKAFFRKFNFIKNKFEYFRK